MVVCTTVNRYINFFMHTTSNDSELRATEKVDRLIHKDQQSNFVLTEAIFANKKVQETLRIIVKEDPGNIAITLGSMEEKYVSSEAWNELSQSDKQLHFHHWMMIINLLHHMDSLKDVLAKQLDA